MAPNAATAAPMSTARRQPSVGAAISAAKLTTAMAKSRR
jgi:hypothetical protein